ncbi:MAG: tripartite tricarboxylate transporter permease [Verrucomicrobia bacterium]|nr:tripartite tricarboxylate transporter permease [Verrucomicrobiota bacterium]MDA1069583.1 tripartite tricarboxylate transporter permease [Verrucomicrobiota bacterium]
MQEAIQQLFTPTGLFLILLGTSLGIFVGAVPGLTGTMLIALVLPLTYGADPQYALTLLISIYVGAVSGGMITSILLRMPGTPASIVTTFDGYPMAQKGQAERALGLGVMSSFVGGLISWGFLVMLARPIALLSTKFGPFEYFSLVLMALVLIASLGGKSVPRSLFSGFLGILLSMPGIAAATGETRLTFGIEELLDGFKLLPVLIGLFAVNQIFRDIMDIKKENTMKAIETKGVSIKWRDFTHHWFNLIRSSVIGTWIGLLPGIGGNIGSVTAYTVAKSSSKNPEKFGTGCEDGVVAGEAANNATIGGALIPLISMGLPGSVVEAVLLGALVIHGLQPGPRLFEEHPVMVYTIMGAMFLANIAMAVIMIVSMRGLAKISQIPRNYLLPVILIFCVIGSFALSNRLFDVWVMLGFGALGFLLESKNIPLAPFVIGFVLGPIAEENLTSGLISTNGSWLPIVTRPIPLVFLLVALTMLMLPFLRKQLSKASTPLSR